MNLHTAHKRTDLDNRHVECLNFATVKRAVQLNDPGCLFANSIIIESDREGEIKKILKILRRSNEPEMYLKPVF